MIADFDKAKHVSGLMLQISEQLNESVRTAEGTFSELEFVRYRRAVGGIIERPWKF